MDRGLPVAPIRPAPHGAWAEVLLLTNAALSVAVEPGSGRVVDLSFRPGSNVLHATQGAGGEGLRTEGGTIGGLAWTAHAWLSDDGANHLRMSGTPKEQPDLTVTREIQVGSNTSGLRVRQEIRAGEGQSGPLPLFQALRLPCPDRILVPTGPDSALEDGFQMLAMGDGQHVMSRCEGTVVLDCAYGGRYAVGSDSPRGWLAAVTGNQLLLMRVLEGSTTNALPGQAVRLRVVNDRPAGFSELHLAGPGADGNLVELSIHPVAGDLPPCELAARVQALAGDDRG